MKLMTVIGARPQFIKAATVSRVLAAQYPAAREILVHTGQHYDANMSDVFFDELDIPRPDHHLGVGGGSHGQNTGRMLEKLDALIIQEKPDWVLVYGDTDSTLAGALAAAKLHVPVAHVEAGLRFFNRRMPGEINRVLTDHVADLLFAPTRVAQHNLQKEGVVDSKIHVVGDVMYDASLYYKALARKPEWFDALGIEDFVLCTIHRAENTDDAHRMQGILSGLAESSLPVVLPLHPRTRKQLAQFRLSLPDTIRVVEPVGYLEMVWLESHCRLVVTDSGGVQKEAYFYGKPCVTLGDETEWVELVDVGVNVLVGADRKRIVAGISQVDLAEFEANGLYGRGDSVQRILERLFVRASSCAAV
ncbi:non-hydrolyzing UDP-N-acetylglucosamine 2-epimerase [Castellaniella denitrificans]|uniref:UDP-N-acetylglucosamine 2-epimerase (Non-hydrolyzing) n=1 Tax=Castellaniella denitrificans TaxID=56119 RepID=A0ABT4M380_9BURK|nr:UDP-N-acetylglucosamine 2-epimerase (non-hydrolyzing) [Castellaniella denitrificans]MCZ4328571.1 UDP-N-acetylglucosamine 2-epimerase (non-hydrolyzing) [Castellaniella denitrificans]